MRRVASPPRSLRGLAGRRCLTACLAERCLAGRCFRGRSLPHRALPTSASTSSTPTGTSRDSTSCPRAAGRGVIGRGRGGGESRAGSGWVRVRWSRAGQAPTVSSAQSNLATHTRTHLANPHSPTLVQHPQPPTCDCDVILNPHADAGQAAKGRVIRDVQPRLDGEYNTCESEDGRVAGMRATTGKAEPLGTCRPGSLVSTTLAERAVRGGVEFFHTGCIARPAMVKRIGVITACAQLA